MHVHESGGQFVNPHSFFNLSPKAEITLQRVLVEDAADSDAYPIYDNAASQGGVHVYHSKDGKHTYQVWQDKEGDVLVSKINKDGEAFKGSINGPELGRNLQELPADMAHYKGAGNLGFSPVGVGGSVYHHEQSRHKIDAQDGHAWVISKSVDVGELSAKAGFESEAGHAWPQGSVSVGANLASGRLSGGYVSSPQVGVNASDGSFQVVQSRYEMSAGAGVGMEAGFSFKDLAQGKLGELHNKLKAVPVSVSAFPSTSTRSGDLMEVPLSRREQLELENEALRRELGGSADQELARDLELADPNIGLERPLPGSYAPPPLSLEQRARLEDKLEANRQELGTIPPTDAEARAARQMEDILQGKSSSSAADDPLHMSGPNASAAPAGFPGSGGGQSQGHDAVTSWPDIGAGEQPTGATPLSEAQPHHAADFAGTGNTHSDSHFHFEEILASISQHIAQLQQHVS